MSEPMETVVSEEPKLIKEDSYVIVQKDDCPRLYQVRKGRMISVERFQFTLDGAIGYPFGTTFQVENNELVVDEGSDEEEEVINVENGTGKEEKKQAEKEEGAPKGKGDHEKEEEESMEKTTAEDSKEKSEGIADGEEKEKTNDTSGIDADNRNLQDDSSAQKLSAEDITELKDSGATGEEIVSKLVANSATYKDKTEYSKEKYVKKKKKKYVAKFTLLKPTTRLLCESFSGRQSSKFVNLRVDAVSQLLTMTNAKAGSKFMVIEACNGLLCGAVLERLGGTGALVRLHNDDSHVRLALCAFDFPPHYFDRFCSVSFTDLGKRKDILEKKEELLGQAEADAIAAIQAETALEDEEAQLIVENEESDDEPQSKKRKTEDEEETRGESGKVERVEKEEAKRDKTEDKEETEKEGDYEKEEKADEQRKDESKEEEKKEEETEEEKEKARKKAAEEKRKKEEEMKRKKAEEKRKKEEAKRRKMDDFRKRKRKAEDETRIKNEEFEELKSTVKALELLEEKMDGLIIASKHHPTNIAMKLVDFLKPSRCFAVFSLYREPLTELYHKLRRRGGIVNMYFTEAWVRRFQIIPDRTHPEMNMDGTGGYILTGTVVEKPENKK